jgi:hypothetical protein
MSDLRDGFKVFTHDLKSPLQEGAAVWDGADGFVLPKTTLDPSSSECGAGWNYCASIEQAWKIAGMWPAGRPSVVVKVRASGDAIERGNKRRCSQLEIVERCDDSDLRTALDRFSAVFSKHAEEMADSQWEWMLALARPRRNVRDVERGLRAALKARGLDWKLKRYATAREAWGAWGARGAREAWGAWGAWEALTVQYAALKDWTTQDPLLLTTGIRDAYTAGLELVVPAGPKELGWVMAE